MACHMRNFLPRVRIPQADYDDLVRIAGECLVGCRVQAADGTVLFCPDGQGSYGALWTRDLCYMLEGAGELLDRAEVLAAIDYLLAGQREDGTIPDRRQPDGLSVYNAGPVDKPLGFGPPVDNAMFMAKLLYSYARRHRDPVAFADRMGAVIRAMEAVPRGAEGLVFIDPNRPRPGYGFTDCIAKTGKELCCSLLYWDACQAMASLCAEFEYHEDAHDWYELSERMYDSIIELWDEEYGMYRAASRDCRHLDIWGSAYAAVIRAASKTRAARIAEFLLTTMDDWRFRGHVRHLLRGEYWQRLLVDVPPNTYQNGGFWAVPTGWMARTISLIDPEAGQQLVLDALQEFREHGVHEWIDPDGRHVAGYVASVTNLLGATGPPKGR